MGICSFPLMRVGLILTVNMAGTVVESDQQLDLSSADHFKHEASRGMEIEKSPHGINGAPHGINGAPHGINGAPHGINGAPHGINGAPHGINGAPHGINNGTKMGSGPAHKLLIVDDNPRLLKMLEMRFSESGY